METLVAGSSKAQMKIQQMAFMLVGLAVFFALVGLIYLAISLSSVKEKAQTLQEEEAAEIVKTIANSPELAFTSSSDCDSCVDLDKALMLKELTPDIYENFWNLDFLMIEKIYPIESKIECTRFNYPSCSQIIIFRKTADFGVASTAFITLVRWDESSSQYKYELGKIHASGKNIK